MKKFKMMLSLFMVITIISVSVVPIFAENIVSTERAIISEDLATVMENSEDDEKIKVYLWYKDIDQDEVDALTTEATGLTPESCAVIEEFPSTELMYSLRDGDADAQSRMDAYMERTRPAREEERERTDRYSRKHMEISNEMYIEKSRNIRNDLSISDSDVDFSSQFAPMIIAEMTKAEIENAAKNSNIDEINLYHEYETAEEPSSLTDGGYYGRYSMKTDEVYNVYGLTGAGVNVGLIEQNIPGLVYLVDDNGEETDELEELEIDLDKVNIVEAEGVTIYPPKNMPSSSHSHAYNSFRVMAGSHTGIAKNIDMYATQFVSTQAISGFKNIEAMFDLDADDLLDVVEVNIAYYVPETIIVNGETVINPEYAYSNLAKYYDYLVSYHNTTIVVAGGNDPSIFGERICNPGMGYNVITVSGYDNLNNTVDSDDTLVNYSWKNSIDGAYGCEKPDVIMPINFPGGGTSVASPALTAQIALMLELKPSLSLHPEVVKAIILASCHRKVKQYTEHTDEKFITGSQETMSQGITERQGAGAPDAWTMACIVCQGTYGYGVLNTSGKTVNIVQPPYGAENMNISIAWLRENYVEDETLQSTVPDDVTEAQASNIGLSIYQNDTVVKTSDLTHSSTEMCYIPLSATDYNYQLRLTQNSTITDVRYAYAWSTDNMYAPITINQDSVYHIKNSANSRYMTYDTSSTTPKAVQRAVSTQSAFSDVHQWIVRASDNSYNISPGYGTTELYLGQSDTLSGTSYTSQLNSVAQDINILYNEDGTVSFLNSTNDRILTYSGSSLVWDTYSGNISSLSSKYMWYLEKVNYLCGDVNLDGSLEVGGYTENEDGETVALPGLDYVYIQNYLAKLVNCNNTQLFLADIDKNGYVDLIDAFLINQFAEDKYF